MGHQKLRATKTSSYFSQLICVDSANAGTHSLMGIIGTAGIFDNDNCENVREFQMMRKYAEKSRFVRPPRAAD
jgi:hypothetical protein